MSRRLFLGGAVGWLGTWALGEVGAAPPPEVCEEDRDLLQQGLAVAYIEQVQPVLARWPTLTPLERLAGLGGAAQFILRRAHIPRIETIQSDSKVKPLRAAFASKPWSLTFDPHLLARPMLSPDEQNDMMGVLYHECRHTQQFWRMARLCAGRGARSRQEVQRGFLVHDRVADQALSCPLGPEHPRTQETQFWYDKRKDLEAAHNRYKRDRATLLAQGLLTPEAQAELERRYYRTPIEKDAKRAYDLVVSLLKERSTP